MHGEQIILKAIKADAVKDRSEFHKDYIWTLLHYLLASEKLEIRFAINTITSGDRNLYHPKGGYFLFPDGEGVAHEGSFNESESGHEFNNETVHQKGPTVVYYAPIKSSSVYREHKEISTTHYYEDESTIYVNRLSAKGAFQGLSSDYHRSFQAS